LELELVARVAFAENGRWFVPFDYDSMGNPIRERVFETNRDGTGEILKKMVCVHSNFERVGFEGLFPFTGEHTRPRAKNFSSRTSKNVWRKQRSHSGQFHGMLLCSFATISMFIQISPKKRICA
jgi:hypothetical protein